MEEFVTHSSDRNPKAAGAGWPGMRAEWRACAGKAVPSNVAGRRNAEAAAMVSAMIVPMASTRDLQVGQW